MAKPDRELTPGPVPLDVLKYFGSKGLKPSFSYLDTWHKEHAFAFTAAKVTRFDVLSILQDHLTQAIADGTPFEAWAKGIQPDLEKAGWWAQHEQRDPITGKLHTVDPPSRLKLIYTTNLRTARAAAQYERIQRTTSSRPYLLWVLGPSARHRPEHLAWAGTLLPADDPFWSRVWPPCGYRCLCSLRSVSRTEHADMLKNGVPSGPPKPILDDDGHPTGHVSTPKVPPKTTAPILEPVIYKNPRTGQVVTTYRGVDPSFAGGNPTEVRKRMMDEAKRRIGE